MIVPCIIPDENALSFEEEMDNAALKDIIVGCFQGLSKREEQVIRLRFGITDNIDSTHLVRREVLT